MPLQWNTEPAFSLGIEEEYLLVDLATHARAEGAATLDAEHAVNRRLRDNGVGLVPRVIEVDAVRP